VVSVHTGVPVEHPSVPVWQRLLGVQLVPSLHVTQLPFEQTMPVPHAVPSARLPLSTHVETPVAHEVFPAWQAVASWHAFPSEQAVQVPELQT
jgi:hypothetical protein